MATTTTNYGLTKPEYTDTADIADINGNMDKVDAALGGLGAGIAIVSNNNTHAAITSGQYVYVHGHSTLTEGLYVATANVAANGTLSSSNMTAAGGALNTLNSKITTSAVQAITLSNVDTGGTASLWKSGNTVMLRYDFTCSQATNGEVVGTLPAGYRPPTTIQHPFHSVTKPTDGYTFISISSAGTFTATGPAGTRFLDTFTFVAMY